jgi:hypothetical protein
MPIIVERQTITNATVTRLRVNMVMATMATDIEIATPAATPLTAMTSVTIRR